MYNNSTVTVEFNNLKQNFAAMENYIPHLSEMRVLLICHILIITSNKIDWQRSKKVSHFDVLYIVKSLQ